MRTNKPPIHLLSACILAVLGASCHSPEGSDPDPDEAPDDEPPPEVLRIEGAHGTVCAYRSSDVPVCWGGQADWSIIGDDEPASEGRLDPPLLPFEQLEMIGLGCGLHDGRVYCWGRGLGQGLLGYGLGESEVEWHQALERGGVAIGEPVVALDSGGSSHTGESQICALGESGSVVCWGSAYGLGYPGMFDYVGDDETPAEMGPINIGGEAVAIDVDGAGICAMLAEGGVRCWGTPLINGGTLIGHDEHPAEGPLLDLGAPIQAVSVGDGHACAIVGEGEVKCWGSDQNGALGRPGVSSAGPSASLEAIELGGSAVEIAARIESTCARLENGDIVCWGSGAYGRLGHPWPPECEVEGGVFFSCSVDPSCCIGDDETPLDAGPVDLPEPAQDLVNLSIGACVLTESGDVLCWGGGLFGLFGDGMQPDCFGDNIDSCLFDPRCCIGDDETPADPINIPVPL